MASMRRKWTSSVAAVHDVDGARLDQQVVEEGHIRAFSLGHVHHRRDQPAQIELRVQLDGRVPPSIAPNRSAFSNRASPIGGFAAAMRPRAPVPAS